MALQGENGQAAAAVTSAGHLDSWRQSGVEPLSFVEGAPSRRPLQPLFGASLKLSRELRAARSAAERETWMRGVIAASPFDWVGYSTLVYRPEGIAPRGFFSTYGNAAWASLYFAEQLYRIDPRLRRDRFGAMPIVWDIEDVIAALPWDGELSRQAELFASGMRDAQIGSGVSLLFPSEPGSQEWASINFMSRSPSRQWIGDPIVGHALTLGMCLHEFVERPARRAEPHLPGIAALSRLQQLIVQSVKAGQTDKEMAALLGLSVHSLDYQLRLLRRRFGARNRAQLVRVAMESGLLD